MKDEREFQGVRKKGKKKITEEKMEIGQIGRAEVCYRERRESKLKYVHIQTLQYTDNNYALKTDNNKKHINKSKLQCLPLDF